MAHLPRDVEEVEDDVVVGEELPPGEPETAGEKLVAKTPWWVISVGMHAMVALIVGFFWVVSAVAEEEAVVVTPPRRPRPKPQNPSSWKPTRPISISDWILRQAKQNPRR